MKAKDGVDNREALAREAGLLASLSHPQIPRLVESGVDADIPYIVTEFLGYPRHHSELLDEDSAPEMAARLCLLALRPLEYLHQEGIAHRDVKTKNLVMRMSGWVGLVDLELSLREGTRDFQPEGRVLGTTDYIAPERARGESGDYRSDIYAMGIVMYQLLAGKLPFYGYPNEVMHDHIHAEINCSHPLARPMPDSLAAIIKRATQKDPADRYESAAAMGQDLGEYLEMAS